MFGRLAIGTAALFLALGCGGVLPATDPDAMSAEAHRREAARQGLEAREQREKYDPDESARMYERWQLPYPFGYTYYGYGDSSSYGEEDYYWGPQVYNPTESHLREAEEHDKEAREHVRAARILEDFEAAQCRAFPAETRVVCPLLGQVEAVEDVFGGVRVTFTEGVNINGAVAHMRCHLAFARARGNEGMGTCPLYLRGARVERVKRARSVDITVRDRDDLEALRSRTRAHLSSPRQEGEGSLPVPAPPR